MPTLPDPTPSQPQDGAVPTPENTPIPGGGRWRWDDESKAWVSNDPAPEQE